MATDGVRYRSGANGGGRQGRRVEDAESGMSEAANQQAQECVRESRKRKDIRQQDTEPDGGGKRKGVNGGRQSAVDRAVC